MFYSRRSPRFFTAFGSGFGESFSFGGWACTSVIILALERNVFQIKVTLNYKKLLSIQYTIYNVIPSGRICDGKRTF